MPKYVYRCPDCKETFQQRFNREPSKDDEEEFIVFETQYSIHADKKEISDASACPRCDSKRCTIAYDWHSNDFYFRGNGLVRDIQGARRDMNVHKLVNDDPYAEYRVSGEVDDLKAKLQRTGDYRKGKRSHTDMKINDKDVVKAVDKKPTKDK